MSRLKPFGYLLAYLIPALLPLSWWLGRATGNPDAWAWFPLLFLFVLVPLADHLIGRDEVNPAGAAATGLERQHWYRALTLACLPLYLGLLWWSAGVFADGALSAVGQLGWVWSQGSVGGVLAINVAHELIHKPGRLEPLCGGVLLASVGYGGFKIEHLRGHHVHVSTPLDHSSAARGVHVYAFVAQAVPHNIANAFRLEAERLRLLTNLSSGAAASCQGGHALPLRRRSLNGWHWRNEMLQWSALSLLLLALFGWVFGAAGLLFFGGQALVALISLEIINYIEHYGLQRRRLDDGRYERTTHLHSWNSSFLLTNLLLFQLQRHSDHHATPRRRYQALLHHPDAPQLPSGYAGMFVLALLPPLWFRIMDRRLPAATP